MHLRCDRRREPGRELDQGAGAARLCRVLSGAGAGSVRSEAQGGVRPVCQAELTVTYDPEADAGFLYLPYASPASVERDPALLEYSHSIEDESATLGLSANMGAGLRSLPSSCQREPRSLPPALRQLSSPSLSRHPKNYAAKASGER